MVIGVQIIAEFALLLSKIPIDQYQVAVFLGLTGTDARSRYGSRIYDLKLFYPVLDAYTLSVGWGISTVPLLGIVRGLNCRSSASLPRGTQVGGIRRRTRDLNRADLE